MKRYLLFKWQDKEAHGGWGDFQNSYESEDDAMFSFEVNESTLAEIIDTEHPTASDILRYDDDCQTFPGAKMWHRGGGPIRAGDLVYFYTSGKPNVKVAEVDYDNKLIHLYEEFRPAVKISEIGLQESIG